MIDIIGAGICPPSDEVWIFKRYWVYAVVKLSVSRVVCAEAEPAESRVSAHQGRARRKVGLVVGFMDLWWVFRTGDKEKLWRNYEAV